MLFPRRPSSRRCAPTALSILHRSSLVSAALTGLCESAAATPTKAVVIRTSEWPLAHFQADEIWHMPQGQGITATVDTGANTAHPNLKGAEPFLERAA